MNAHRYESQAIGRLLRYGQKEDVHVWRFVTRGTVETEITIQHRLAAEQRAVAKRLSAEKIKAENDKRLEAEKKKAEREAAAKAAAEKEARERREAQLKAWNSFYFR